MGLRCLGEAALEADMERVGVKSSVIWVESLVDTERKVRDKGHRGNQVWTEMKIHIEWRQYKGPEAGLYLWLNTAPELWSTCGAPGAGRSGKKRSLQQAGPRSSAHWVSVS